MPRHHSRKETTHQRSDLTGEHRFGDAGQLLLARFGEEYQQYMIEVPVWIPRLWKRH